MPIQISCPSCKGAVRVPEDLLGKRVQCPRCQATFVAEVEEESPPAAPAVAERPVDAGEPVAPRPRRPARVDEYDDYDDYGDRPRRRYGSPHRGGVILTLGILGLVICAPLGIFAWVMGSNDLAQMKRGQMDRAGEGLTQAGRILGIIACVLMILGCVFYGIFFAMLGAGHRF